MHFKAATYDSTTTNKLYVALAHKQNKKKKKSTPGCLF